MSDVSKREKVVWARYYQYSQSGTLLIGVRLRWARLPGFLGDSQKVRCRLIKETPAVGEMVKMALRGMRVER